jgi:dimethylhistidine N-methyltransferase
MTAKEAQLTASNVQFHDAHPATADCHAEVLAGLRETPRRLDPKWFYDEAGSQLFEEITRLPEYYPTRTETAILESERRAIAERCGRDCVFIEPGAGNCEKARLLLDALRPAAFVPLDISADFLLQAALAVGSEHPWLTVNAICADFNEFRSFEAHLPPGRRIVFYPGSTIGNLEPAAAADFLRGVRTLVGPDGGVIVGVDLHKSAARLEAAYNDSAGVTARFNLNILERLNALVGSDFDVANFRHRAFYNVALQRIEMHLESLCDQQVHIAEHCIPLRQGECLHTESSYKYTVEGFAQLAAEAGLALRQSWLDGERLFSLHYLEPAVAA